MNNFMNYDFNITDIMLAIYFQEGKGARVHKNRASHGIAFNVDSDTKSYIFENNKTILVEHNEIIYLPKGSNYTVSSTKSGNCYAINFEISETVDFEPFTFKVKNSAGFIKEFEKTANLWKNKSTSFHMQCKASLYTIISMFQNEYNSKYMTNNTLSMISPAIEYIKKNYTDADLCINELSSMCNISEDYFRKIFKNSFGISPIKYINAMKLSYAKELIKSGMYTVTESAELSGFNDMSYFSREFKKSFGVCPADYKKLIQKNQK